MKQVAFYLVSVALGAAIALAYLSPNPNPEGWSDRVVPVYTNVDIIYVDVDSLRIYYESSPDVESFSTFNDLCARIEKLTAISQSPAGYSQDIRYQASQGYITANIHPKLDHKGKVLSEVGIVEIWYNGPGWAINPEKDTSFLLTSFNQVNKHKSEYDPCLSCDYNMWIAYSID